jgi:hypothetical protein
MAGEGAEELLVLGPDRPPRSTRWLAALAVAAFLAGVVVLALHHRRMPDRHPAAAATAGTATAARPAREVPMRPVEDQYLVQVPPGDMRAALASAACRAGCTAHTLVGHDLDRAAGDFAGLRPLAGGFVTTDAGRAVQQSIEGRAKPDALVHLVVERTAAPATGRVRTTDQPGDGFRAVQLTMVRDGWRFTAGLVVRGAVPPVGAAAVWVRSAPPPG